jgi:phage I-like protein
MEITGSLFLALNVEEGIPDRIMLVPCDKVVKGRDNREWKNPNPKQTAINSNARLAFLPVDENHSTDLAAPKGGASPAMGWMKNLCADENGAIWAEVEWTERGRGALVKKEYRFISPVFLYNEKSEINCILRAALTNTPNLNLPALNAERPENIVTEVHMNEELLAALGLGETATEAEALAAARALNAAKSPAKPQADTSAVDLAAYAPRADLSAMEARALAAEKQLAELDAAALLRDAEAAVDEAIKNRKVPPASREEYLAFCSTKEGLEKMKTIFSKSPAIIGAETQAPEGAPPAAGGGAALNAEETALARAMGYSTEEYQKIKEGKK